mgnify:CR=1 FL=1
MLSIRDFFSNITKRLGHDIVEELSVFYVVFGENHRIERALNRILKSNLRTLILVTPTT